jgi:hypothetical protein
MMEQPRIHDMSDAEWWLSPQRHKRLACLERIKAKPLYIQAMQCCSSNAAVDRPCTPEADDKAISKRHWETLAMNWRHSLKALVNKKNNVISLCT